MRQVDVLVVGGGPAGLAVALEARARGVEAVVVERAKGELDKACGEGLMPAGRAALERLGVTPHLAADDCAPFRTITYWQERGGPAVGALPAPYGLGVRRLALSRALRARAAEAGVEVVEGAGARDFRVNAGAVDVDTDAGAFRAKLLVGADGLHSPTRAKAGLAVAGRHDARRFGLRQHFAVAPWADTVEVHFAEGVEAYVTPAGARRVGVAFLWDAAQIDAKVSFDALLGRFPRLQARVAGAPSDSAVRGAGPLRQRVARTVAPGVVLVGDAAGYVDAITGEGLSLAFEGAHALGGCLRDALARPTDVAALAPYEAAAARAFARYRRLAGSLVWIAARPWLRRPIVRALAVVPGLFDRALASLATAPPPAVLDGPTWR